MENIMADEKDVNQEPIQPEGEIQEPATPEQQTQDTETSTPKEEVNQEQEAQQTENRVPYDRFKEKVDEANLYKRQLELSQQLIAQQTQTPEPVPSDPYANVTAEEREFYRKRDERTREIVREEQKAVQEQIKVGRAEMARLMTHQFRQQHPDIKQDSPEEVAIAQKIQRGYTTEDAYRSVMWDKKMGPKQMQTNQQQQQRLEAKQKANIVSPASVSSQNAPAQKVSFEDELRHKLNTEWNGQI